MTLRMTLSDRFKASRPTPKAPSNSGLGGITIGLPTRWANAFPTALFSHSPLQKHLLPDRALSFDFRKVVLGDGINQAGENVVASLALLLGNADVGIDERRTGCLEFHRSGCTQCDLCDIRDIDPQVALGRSSRNEPVPAEQALFIA
jgi:hypothetical protein